MRISHLKLNHLTNPVGYDLSLMSISYVISEAAGNYQKSARVLVAADEDFSDIVYDSGVREDIRSTGFELPIELQPQTRYYWKVFATDDAGDEGESEIQWFETAKSIGGVTDPEEAAALWQAKWITPDADKSVQAVVLKDIEIVKPVEKARFYVTGLGVYEFYLDGIRRTNECLLPGYCDYDTWIQYQTYITELGEGSHRIEIVLGDGWYKGNFGLRIRQENYGDRLAALAELHIWYKDGTKEVIVTDETWKARKSRVVSSGIYCGECYDASLNTDETFGVSFTDLGYTRLSPRLSPPLTVHEHIRPKEVIISPKGETILDMGQNMVGWISFHCTAPAGARIHLQTGEILQEGCFYNENLRTAKSEFVYISDGQDRWVRQHFTFYGFRFVKVEGWPGEVRPEDFVGLVIHSDMEALGDITTSDPLVNQLVKNARWGMKGNFLDVPTDCPQRDERYGWTGDAQIFSGTACFFMDTDAFYTKYGKDVYAEQVKLGGSVPDVVPVCNYPGDASTAWGDAATIIPWNVYLHFGDTGILRRQYESMKGWVDYMYRQDEADGSRRLWLTGTHYADWLALDGNYPGGVYGGTDPGYIASGYYYYSTSIVAKTAAIIGKKEDAAFYGNLAREIRAAFEREYFTPSGRLAIDTMTGYVVALYMGLTPDYAHDQVCRGLLNKLKKNFYHLETGFVGTPYLCRVLSENGMNDLAYHLLLEKGYPGWLYEVLMGATTIWERWNSVQPDGKISGTEMNSLNHYSYGSIVEWMFRNMTGINPSEEAAGFKRFTLAPKPDYQIKSAAGRLRSASGLIESSWKIEDGTLTFAFTVPFDTTARIVLPDARAEDIRDCLEKAGRKVTGTDGKNGWYLPREGKTGLEKDKNDTVLYAGPGTYEFVYTPTVPYRKVYSLDSTWEELKANPKTKAILDREYKTKEDHIPFEKELCTLEEMTWGPFTCVPQEQREKIDRLLREVE